MPTMLLPRRPTVLLCVAALVLGLGACGQKGALYHPEPADAPAETEKKDDEKKPAGAPR